MRAARIGLPSSSPRRKVGSPASTRRSSAFSRCSASWTAGRPAASRSWRSLRAVQARTRARSSSGRAASTCGVGRPPVRAAAPEQVAAQRHQDRLEHARADHLVQGAGHRPALVRQRVRATSSSSSTSRHVRSHRNRRNPSARQPGRPGWRRSVPRRNLGRRAEPLFATLFASRTLLHPVTEGAPCRGRPRRSAEDLSTPPAPSSCSPACTTSSSPSPTRRPSRWCRGPPSRSSRPTGRRSPRPPDRTGQGGACP